MTHTIVGFFASPAQAKSAVSELMREGFARDQVSVIASDARTAPATLDTPDLGPVEETGSQSDAGGKAAIGGMAGAILGIAALAVPGIGPLLAAGPLAMAITGAAAGAATGGLIGALQNQGVPEERAQRYSRAISSGSVMVSVHTSENYVDQAADVLDRNGAIDIDEPADRITPVRATTQPLPDAVKFDESESMRARRRERNVDVFPGITGGGPTANY